MGGKHQGSKFSKKVARGNPHLSKEDANSPAVAHRPDCPPSKERRLVEKERLLEEMQRMRMREAQEKAASGTPSGSGDATPSAASGSGCGTPLSTMESCPLCVADLSQCAWAGGVGLGRSVIRSHPDGDILILGTPFVVLNKAATESNLRLLQELLPLLTVEDINSCHPDTGRAALHWAARANCLDCAKLLVSAGARLDVTDACGRTPLHEAAANARTALVQWLLQQGADVNAKSSGEAIPLHFAVNADDQAGGVACAKLLLEAGSAVDARDDSGSTPVHTAQCRGNVEAVRCLVAAGADVHSATCASANWTGLQELCALGARANHSTDTSHARIRQVVEMAQVLMEEFKVDPHAKMKPSSHFNGQPRSETGSTISAFQLTTTSGESSDGMLFYDNPAQQAIGAIIARRDDDAQQVSAAVAEAAASPSARGMLNSLMKTLSDTLGFQTSPAAAAAVESMVTGRITEALVAANTTAAKTAAESEPSESEAPSHTTAEGTSSTQQASAAEAAAPDPNPSTATGQSTTAATTVDDSGMIEASELERSSSCPSLVTSDDEVDEREVVVSATTTPPSDSTAPLGMGLGLGLGSAAKPGGGTPATKRSPFGFSFPKSADTIQGNKTATTAGTTTPSLSKAGQPLSWLGFVSHSLVVNRISGWFVGQPAGVGSNNVSAEEQRGLERSSSCPSLVATSDEEDECEPSTLPLEEESDVGSDEESEFEESGGEEWSEEAAAAESKRIEERISAHHRLEEETQVNAAAEAARGQRRGGRGGGSSAPNLFSTAYFEPSFMQRHSFELAAMSCEQLKAHLSAVGVDSSGAVEKRELVALATAQGSCPVAAAAKARAAAAEAVASAKRGKAVPPRGPGKDPEAMPRRELERLLASAGVDYSDAIDKEELVKLYVIHELVSPIT